MKKNVFEKHPKKTVLFTIIFLSSLSICILQLISYLMISSFLKNPEIIKNSKIIKPTIQKLYMSYDRNIIQYLDYAAQYDQELMYILKPGNFTVKNREHSSIYSINKLGFRDDEKSLTKPSIVVIGDSHSMGWGVQQNETFAHLVEKQLNKTVLNTGVSSYGTARESIALRRVDTSNLKYLIIQYCLNDFSENKDFVNNNYNLFISPKESYLNIVKGHMDRDRRPYLSIQIMAQIILDKILATPIEDIERKKERKNRNEEIEAKYFLDILARLNLHNVQIIVFEINGNNRNDSLFIEYVENLIKEKGYPKFINNIKTIRAEKILTDNDYFILDDHINRRGHESLANAIVNVINKAKE